MSRPDVFRTERERWMFHTGAALSSVCWLAVIAAIFALHAWAGWTP